MNQLDIYKRKRNFDSSPEPAGMISKSGYPLPIFVIQRHDARNLHFDLRLEHRGILLSWAMPQKPVLNKDFKRLAIHVEDHPLDYANFSGLIPEGNYGAGVVDIWDRGFYYLEDAYNKTSIEELMDNKLKKGHFILYLKGRKLDGKFVLVKLGQSEDDWLFYYDNNDKHEPDQIDDDVHFGFVPPMLPGNIDKPFDSPEWLFEPKLDGYRIIAVVEYGKIKLISRNGKDLTADYPLITDQLKGLRNKMVLDGELIALDSEGKPSFSLLHNNKAQRIYLYLFDVLFYKRSSLQNFTLLVRKAILDSAFTDQANIKKLPIKKEKGSEYFNTLIRMGFEGMVAKRINSRYESGRTHEWLKIKKDKSLDLFVIGYIPDERGKFKSLMIAEKDKNNTFTYRGNVGSGFSEKDKNEIIKLINIIPRPRNITNLPPLLGDVFVKPSLKIEVGYLEVTSEGRLRHPTFKRIRDDKS